MKERPSIFIKDHHFLSMGILSRHPQEERKDDSGRTRREPEMNSPTFESLILPTATLALQSSNSKELASHLTEAHRKETPPITRITPFALDSSVRKNFPDLSRIDGPVSAEEEPLDESLQKGAENALRERSGDHSEAAHVLAEEQNKTGGSERRLRPLKTGLREPGFRILSNRVLIEPERNDNPPLWEPQSPASQRRLAANQSPGGCPHRFPEPPRPYF